ncbi:MAG TPA: TCP-1/cpn60 chaperonin family protein [Candidatus Binatia bacterium]|nr:TCP-1/cpn60 chaperonin family protein [Candidatus Binatia bacterium]
MEKVVSVNDIISSKYQRTAGKDVWRENLRTTIFAADKIRSTLGPQGSYKLITYNKGPEQVIKVTKDAIAILDELAIQYPPAVIVSEAAKLQREETGDGVAGFVIFLSALLKKADELLGIKIHANTIIHGYHLATEKSLEILECQAATLNRQSSDILDLVDCKRNILTPQIRSMIRQAYPFTFSKGVFERENIRFLKKNGGSLRDSSLIHGIVIKKQKAHPCMPDKIRGLRIVVTSERLGINRLEVKMPGQGPYHINLNVKAPGQIQKYNEAVQKVKDEPIRRLIELDVNVLLSGQPIEDYSKTKLFTNGIFALENVDKNDTKTIAKATGARIVGGLTELGEEDVGIAEELYTGCIELEKTVTFNGCNGATFMLRGSTPQAIDELETAIKNSFTVLKLVGDDGRLLAGGGAVEAHVSQELKTYARQFASREQVVIEAFANALLEIPRCLAENNGLNPTDALLELKQRNSEGFCNVGVDEHSCCEMVCQEPLKIKRSVLRRAFEVSMLMLHIDELIISKEIPKFHKK